MSRQLSSQPKPETAWFPDALTQKRFETWFQPILDTSADRILGHECLIRLRGERLYSGAEIVGTARARNEMARFDDYARALAVESSAAQTRDEPRGDLFFVNLLPASMTDPYVAMRAVMDALSGTALRPANFVFELVESDLVGDSSRLRDIQSYLRDNGFGLALDNMGLGPDTFQMIHDFQPDFVKIDQRLVCSIERPLAAATVRKIVEVAAGCDAKVIAAGVERARHVENLWLLGVHLMQGYFFRGPSPEIMRAAAKVETLPQDLYPECKRLIQVYPPPVFADLNHQLA